MKTRLSGLVKLKEKRERIIVGSLFSIVFLFVFNLLLLNPQPVQAALVSLGRSSNSNSELALQTTGELSSPHFSDIVASRVTLDPEQVVGVLAPGLFELPVIQQPEDKPWFVSSDPEVVTQFNLASEYGSLGFLAHNTLVGSIFHELQLGQEVIVLYGDGESQTYKIGEILQYQALDPDNPYSPFRALNTRGADLSSTDLFNLIYAVPRRVVFQTCIEFNGDPNWGRYFVIADPVIEWFSFLDLLPF